MSDLQVKAEFMVCEHGSLARVCLICELQRENADVRARLEAAERDAGRYRWLREPQEHACVEFEDENEDGYTNAFYSKIRNELDAAIDAAMQEKK